MSAKRRFIATARRFFALTLVLSLIGGHEALAATSPKVGDWVYVDHDLGGTRYSALASINTHNANGLQKVCSYSFPAKEPSQTAPVVVNGIVYANSAHYTVALNGSNCRIQWTSQWAARGPEPFNTTRGVAYAEGKIVRGTADDYLLALDAGTGRLLWSRQIADPRDGHFISMPPLVHNGLIYIGPAGSEWGARGWVGAYRLSDGNPMWRLNLVAPGRTGGNLWTPMSFDVDRHLLYVPVGNPAPDFYDDQRPGADKYTSSLLALDAKTGYVVWYKQVDPHDTHDYDLTHVAPIVKTATRTIIATTGKDGLLRAFDADTHQVVYSVPFTTRLKADDPATTIPQRVCPGTLGGNEWNGASYDAKLGFIFAPATDWCDTISKSTQPPDPLKEHSRGAYFGGPQTFDSWNRARGWLTAFQAANGKVVWRYRSTKPLIGGVTATAGSVVFTGEMTGDFLALNGQTGKVLYRKAVGGPVAGGVVTYSAHNQQYIAVVSGFVGAHNMMAPEIGGPNPKITIFGFSGPR